MGLRILYGRKIIIGNKIARKLNRKSKREEYHEIKQERQDGR